MGDFEPIPIKMKMAESQQVTDAMVAAVREWGWSDELLRLRAPDLVHEIHRALSSLAVVMIVLDVETSA